MAPDVGVPVVMTSKQPPAPKALDRSTGRRLWLADWVASKDNPLTARVFVNRLWKLAFGQGIVKSLEDFGSQGSPPTHPQLLDWLATEFVAQKWSMKAMHRLIVTSATYRQASTVRPEAVSVDPRNRLLARQSRLRRQFPLRPLPCRLRLRPSPCRRWPCLD